MVSCRRSVTDPDAGAAERSARFRQWAPVAGRLIWRGTHRGLFLGLAPTDEPVTVAAFHMVRLSAGHWSPVLKTPRVGALAGEPKA